MKHGRIPIEIARQHEFGKTRASKKRAPVRQCGDALPAILHGEGCDVHPVAGRDFTVLPALFIDFRVEVVAGAQVPGQIV